MEKKFSYDDFTSKKDVDTICFNMNIFESNIEYTFLCIISKIESIFHVKISKNNFKCDFQNMLHIHYEIDNIIFEIKLNNQKKIDHKENIQMKLKIFTQKNDEINKDRFNNLCHECVNVLHNIS